VGEADYRRLIASPATSPAPFKLFWRGGAVMDGEPKPGQKVSWNSHGGEAHGEVVRKVTRRTRIKSHGEQRQSRVHRPD
jgi:hypothetical protein